MKRQFEVVRIKIEYRSGIFHLSSDDVPGLWLWGKDPDAVFPDVVPAIKYLYKHNQGRDVIVKEAFFSKALRWAFTRRFEVLRKDRYRIYPALGAAHG